MPNVTKTKCDYCGESEYPTSPVHPEEGVCMKRELSKFKDTLVMLKAAVVMDKETTLKMFSLAVVHNIKKLEKIIKCQT